MYEHRSKLIAGFTTCYDKLVFYEAFDGPDTAIAREKQIEPVPVRRKSP